MNKIIVLSYYDLQKRSSKHALAWLHGPFFDVSGYADVFGYAAMCISIQVTQRLQFVFLVHRPDRFIF